MINNSELLFIKSSKSKLVKMMYLLGSFLTMLGYMLSVLDTPDEK